MIKNFLLVGLGGAIGSMLRYATMMLIKPQPFPYATLMVNIAGSFLIGLVIAGSLKHDTFALNWRLFLATGICGGFTTFSTLSAESLVLLQNERYALFFGYLLLSIVLGIAAVYLGFLTFKSV